MSETEPKLTAVQTEIFDELDRMAQRHIDESDGRLVLLPRDASQLTPHIVSDNPFLLKDPSILEAQGKAVDPRYPALQQSMDELAGRNGHILAFIDDLLRGENNVILATNHGEIIDIGLVTGTLDSAMIKNGYTHAQQEARHGIITSQIVRRIGLKTEHDPLPADEALKWLFHDDWTSYPPTKSTRFMRHRYSREVKAHNTQMLDSLMESLGRGSLFLAMAPSGTRDKPLEGSPDTYQLERVKDGTINIMSQPHTYTLFTAVWMNDGNPVVEFVGTPRPIRTTEQAHDAMDELADTLNQIVPGHNFTYEAAQAAGRAATKRTLPKVY